MPRLIPLLVLATALLACGGATHAAIAAPVASAGQPSRWSTSDLSRLDRDLRREVRSGTLGRLAIKVYFRRTPSDDELAAMLLSRVGRQFVGSVPLATLHRIAAHSQVDHIEMLRDVGY